MITRAIKAPRFLKALFPVNAKAKSSQKNGVKALPTYTTFSQKTAKPKLCARYSPIAPSAYRVLENINREKGKE
jgi:hypothetical protein